MNADDEPPQRKSGVTARLLEAGFGRPRGVLGRIGGRLMARGNAATERHVVELAGLAETDVVLVVGFGPGVGLHAAGSRCRHVIGIDPSPAMRAAAHRRCGELIGDRIRIEPGVAEDTGLSEAAVDVVLSVNNIQLWSDRHAGLRELHRVLRPGGRLLLSAHRKWLPGGQQGLTSAVQHAGYRDVRSWTWQPPGRGAAAVQLSAHRP